MGKKYDAEGRLDTAEMREFGMAPKLLQLANLVRGTQKNQYYFERYCFYGCHCLPGLTAHDSTDGKGAPQDSIDGTCSHLRQCYLCANKETDGECDGTTMSYSWKFEDFDNDGKADEITCTKKRAAEIIKQIFDSFSARARKNAAITIQSMCRKLNQLASVRIRQSKPIFDMMELTVNTFIRTNATQLLQPAGEELTLICAICILNQAKKAL